MSPSAQRIAIAEHLGFKWPGLRQDKDSIGWNLNGVYYPRLPDYLNDLNAIHEAEKVLTKDDAGSGSHWRYVQELIEVTKAESMEAHREVFVVANATAAQRAEAFLRAFGKWESAT